MSIIESSGSPLEEVERMVQTRAQDISLDLSDRDAEASLRTLINEAIVRWTDEYRRGLRGYDLPDPELVAERTFRNLAG